MIEIDCQDKELVALCKDYWELNGNLRHLYSVQELALKYNKPLKEVTKIAKENSVFTSICDCCNKEMKFSMRSELYKYRFTKNYLHKYYCENCRYIISKRKISKLFLPSNSIDFYNELVALYPTVSLKVSLNAVIPYHYFTDISDSIHTVVSECQYYKMMFYIVICDHEYRPIIVIDNHTKYHPEQVLKKEMLKEFGIMYFLFPENEKEILNGNVMTKSYYDSYINQV